MGSLGCGGERARVCCLAWLHAGGEHPNSLVEGFRSPDALDLVVASLADVPGLDQAALARETAYVREHASKAGEGRGKPLRVEDLRRAAGR